MAPEPQTEHLWLQKLIGEWTCEYEASMGPDQPPVKSEATETVRSLSGLWIVAEGQGDMPGCGPATTMMTLGYDPEKKRYVGTWVGSIMTHMWIYDGAVDASGTRLTLDSEGPGMAGDGTMSKYRDVIEVIDDDHKTLTAQVLGDDGTWSSFMTARYRRKK